MSCVVTVPSYCYTHLRVEGLLHLLLVEVELFLVLGSHLDQRLGQLALIVQLPPAVQLHHARLVAALGLTHLLQTQTGWRLGGSEHLFQASWICLV